MMQRTFGTIVGLDSVVPVGPHPDDDTICSDGTSCKRRHAFIDCKGEPHSNDEDRIETNNQIVSDIVDGHVRWANEYCTENEDFATGYDCIINEGHHNWDNGIDDWLYGVWDDDEARQFLIDNEDHFDHDDFDQWANDLDPDGEPFGWSDYINDRYYNFPNNKLVETIKELIDDSSACDLEYNHNEYNRYEGTGCCLDGVVIGEQEEQIDINSIPEFKALHDSGELNDCLKDYNGDGYIYLPRARVAGKGYVGHEHYDHHGSDYPVVTFTHVPDGRWDWVICHDDMVEYMGDAILQLFEEVIK